VVNYVKLVPYYFLGQLHAINLLTALVLLPLAPVGVYVGLWMQHRITDSTVYRWPISCCSPLAGTGLGRRVDAEEWLARASQHGSKGYARA